MWEANNILDDAIVLTRLIDSILDVWGGHDGSLGVANEAKNASHVHEDVGLIFNNVF